MPDSEQKNILEVQASESGQKLLQFLVRRLNLPQSLLHRWIRTGQIRLNGGRIKPFGHVHTGDILRLPPFALGMNNSAAFEKNAEAIDTLSSHDSTQKAQISAPKHLVPKQTPSPSLQNPLPPTVYSDENIAIYNKPQGLPIHAGTGHTDSFAQRLQAHFKHAVFKPTPAHRLDKDTSGLVCVAFSYTALRALQDAFASRTMSKEYLAWVHGIWPHDTPQKLEHHMQKKYLGTDEKVRILSAQDGKEAVSYVHCLQRTQHHSLMQIRLITGRTHQIRLQMATEGHPILGDGKYGTLSPNTGLFLHSLRILCPETEAFQALNIAGKQFATLPAWKQALAVTCLPAPLVI